MAYAYPGSLQRVPLPTGTIGVSFRGAPPVISGIQSESPMSALLREGQYVFGVSVPGRLEVSNMSDTSTLVEVLTRTSHHERILLVSDASIVNTSEPASFAVSIPPGKVGITFRGSRQPSIQRVLEVCPVRDVVYEGQTLRSIRIPGDPELSAATLSAADVVQFLTAYSSVHNRVLVFSSPPIAIAQPIEPSKSDSTRSLDATIEGEDMQTITFKLRPHQKVISDPSNLIYMTDGMQVQLPKKHQVVVLRGQSVVMTEFSYQGTSGQGTVSFGSTFQSKILPINLEDHDNGVVCQGDIFLCSDDSIRILVEYCPSRRHDKQATFDGHLFDISGTGIVWLNASGGIISRTLARGETMRCSTGAVVAFEKIVSYEMERIKGGFKNYHGVNWTTFTGPGIVWLQSCPVGALISQIHGR